MFLIVVVLKLELIHGNLRLLRRPPALHQDSTIRTTNNGGEISSRAYAASGVEVLRASNDLRTIEAAGIWVEGHDGGTRRELGICIQMRSAVGMCVRVG